MIYFTSDTHFGHKNIIKYCQRPFKTVEEMDEEIIERINAMVRPQDELWHLGDFAFHSKTNSIEGYLGKIKCKVNIVFGSHDKEAIKKKHLFNSAFHGIKRITIEGQKIVLCHCALLTWECRHYGAVHLFGHSHTSPVKRFRCQQGSVDVGVDNCGFFPIPLNEAIARAQETDGKLTCHDLYDEDF
jgi:calcineurin-like phosphoesterase family protein